MNDDEQISAEQLSKTEWCPLFYMYKQRLLYWTNSMHSLSVKLKINKWMNKIPMLCTNSASDRVCQSLTDIGFLRQIPLFRDLKIEYSFRHMTHKHISLIFTIIRSFTLCPTTCWFSCFWRSKHGCCKYGHVECPLLDKRWQRQHLQHG